MADGRGPSIEGQLVPAVRKRACRERSATFERTRDAPG